MPNRTRCKKQREAKLHVAALNVPKLSSFGFTKITNQSVQNTSTNNELEHGSSNVFEESNREEDLESVKQPHTSTEIVTPTCVIPGNSASGTISDNDDLLLADIIQQPARDSNEENNYIPAADNPNADPFSAPPSISVPSKAVFQSESLDMPAPKSNAIPTSSTEHSTAPNSSCKSLCCTQKCVYHPTVDELKKTSIKQTSSDGKHRQCPASIFLKYPWATYCLTQGAIACFFCQSASEKGLITFTNYKENAFCAATFSNWKKWQKKLEKHNKSNFHSEAVVKISSLNNAKMNVGAQLDNKYKDDQKLHRYLLLKQLSSLKFLARQGVALRGHAGMDSNLIQLLKTRSEDVPELVNWIENGHYLSPIIINELLEMMGNTVLRSILEDIQDNSGFFGLIADESRDISNKEQLTCILRWVSLSDLRTHEDFIGMYLVEKPDAETIAASLKDILLRCSLNLDDCFWQAYDGATTMSGHLSGVAARLQSENPIAFRIHCSNHRLDVFFEQISKKAGVLGMVEKPFIPRRHKVPRRLQYGDAEQHHFESEKSMFRAQYFEAIDACLSELSRRFDEKSYALLRQIEVAFLNAANREPFEFNDTLRKTYSNRIDFDQVIAELKLLPGLLRQCLPDIKRATSLDTVISVVNNGQNRLILPMVVRLIQIYLLAPMSAASAERSFSVQRQIKSYLRNMMSERRYNNLLVLNIHKEKTDNIDLIKLAKEFTQKNDRRLRYFGKF